MADGPIWWPKPPGRPIGSPAPYWNLELGTCVISIATSLYDNEKSAIKAYMSQINLQHEQQQWRIGRLQSKKTRVKTDMLRSIGKQSGESVESGDKRKVQKVHDAQQIAKERDKESNVVSDITVGNVCKQ